MLSWKIGDVTVTRVVEMELPVPYHAESTFLKQATPEALSSMPWLYPHFVTPDGVLVLSIHALLVDAPGLKLVVDTCVGNDKARSLLRGQSLQTNFLKDIAEAGFPRESVDAVVCTHLHVDHVGWNTMHQDGKWVPTFPNARYLIGKMEYEHWSAVEHEEQQEIMADSVKPVFDAGLAQTVEIDHRISPEIRLLPTTGHTPGHVSVLIESRGESAIITGDMMHHPCQIGHPEWSPEFDSDKEAAAVTRKAMVKDWADQPILVIGTHFAAPTAGHIRRDGASYRFEV
ncbi:MAG TPA: MBL fold metallo-hydrolase [Rhizomicrobium sp.]|jgi:glyoxylase-like metal-dependent hydrolase (beta-lactamase superfamily II)|nr:MBL fold metallo-hydrolase [Rhizomicrobium sp.]